MEKEKKLITPNNNKATSIKLNQVNHSMSHGQKKEKEKKNQSPHNTKQLPPTGSK